MRSSTRGPYGSPASCLGAVFAAVLLAQRAPLLLDDRLNLDPKLDLAAVAAAEGHEREAERILREDVCDRSDDGQAPMELSERTENIIRSQDWLTPGKAAS